MKGVLVIREASPKSIIQDKLKERRACVFEVEVRLVVKLYALDCFHASYCVKLKLICIIFSVGVEELGHISG